MVSGPKGGRFAIMKRITFLDRKLAERAAKTTQIILNLILKGKKIH